MSYDTSPAFAAFYDWLMRPLEALGVREQRQRCGAAARGRVLEIGAGTGAMFAHYGDDVTEVVATEPDRHMLERARERADEAAVPVTLEVADALDLPFEAASFDTVVIALALCTIPDPGRALDEVRRVLRPDGRLVFLEHVRSRRPAIARIQSLVTPAWKQVARGCHLDRATVAIIEDRGFQFEHVWRSGDGRGSMVQGVATPAGVS